MLDDAGARLLVDLTPQSYTGHSNPQWLTDWNGKLAYSADDGAHGTELWISDGTPAGTKLLADINPGYLKLGSAAALRMERRAVFLREQWLVSTHASRESGCNAGSARDARSATSPR